jgi:hypothetical protein
VDDPALIICALATPGVHAGLDLAVEQSAKLTLRVKRELDELCCRSLTGALAVKAPGVWRQDGQAHRRCRRPWIQECGRRGGTKRHPLFTAAACAGAAGHEPSDPDLEIVPLGIQSVVFWRSRWREKPTHFHGSDGGGALRAGKATVRTYAWLPEQLDWVSLAVTVNAYVPGAVGVPLSVPSPDRLSPVGTLPKLIEKVYGPAGVADSIAL